MMLTMMPILLMVLLLILLLLPLVLLLLLLLLSTLPMMMIMMMLFYNMITLLPSRRPYSIPVILPFPPSASNANSCTYRSIYLFVYIYLSPYVYTHTFLDEEVTMLVVLRINVDFMEFMREHYGNKIVKQPWKMTIVDLTCHFNAQL